MTYRQAIFAHLSVTAFMAGVVWFVQIVHYPLLARVGAENFRAYHKGHSFRTACLVVGPMLAEVAAAGALLWLAPPGPQWLALFGAVLLILIWAVTFTLQVPLHRSLESGFDEAVIGRLVRTNWIRTCAWTLRLAVALTFFFL